ncbi:MAG: hypothetical protein K2I72_00320, partial [Bacilli bacterium]|nr:hypothetical protein [Bacilli bacterium]
ENDFQYAILDMRGINSEIGMKILEIYHEIRKNFSNSSSKEKEETMNQVQNLIGDNTNFFYKKTIYKVKRGNVE